MQIKNNIKHLANKDKSVKGFSLIETTVALTTLGICLAYAMPLFLYAKINNSKSEVRTGALIVSQRIFDDIRSKSIASLPKDNASVDITDASVLKAMGRVYTAKVTYCQVATDCTDKYRKFKVEVKNNGAKAYDLEGTYTDFSN
jgi:Tfp pilus assembly protein PilV